MPKQLQTSQSDEANKSGVSPHAPGIVSTLYERAHKVNVSMLTVCKQAGVHHDVVGRWRRGRTSPTVRTLHKILQAIEHFEKHPPVVPL